MQGKKAVCYPGFEERLTGAAVGQEPVVTQEYITTSRGMGTAIDFALELVRLLAGKKSPKALHRAFCIRAEMARQRKPETKGERNVVEI